MANPIKNIIRSALTWAGDSKKEIEKPARPLVPFASLASSNWGKWMISGFGKEQELNEYVGWAYACVSKIAAEVAAAEINLYRVTKKGIEEVNNHAAKDIIEKVNPWLTMLDLQELNVANILLTGDSYWWIQKNAQGIPIQIYPWLRPDRISPVPHPTKFIQGYIYTVPGEVTQVPFGTDEIVHFQSLNPLSPYKGTGTITAIRHAIETDRLAEEFNERFFYNSARPDGALIFEDGLDEDQVKMVKEEWEKSHGYGKEHKTAILSRAKYESIGMSQKDMDFLEQRRFSRDQILAMFKVPKFMLGMIEDVNRASAEASRLFFATEVVKPILRKIVSTMNEMLIPMFPNSDGLFYDFEDPAAQDRELKLKEYDVMSKIGAMTINEIRQEEGRDPIEGGDVVYLPLNLVELGSESPFADSNNNDNNNQQQEKPKGLAAGYIKLGKTKNGSSKRHVPNIAIKKTLEQDRKGRIVGEMLGMSATAKQFLLDINSKNRVDEKRDRNEAIYESLWRSKIARTDAYEKRFEGFLREQFERQEKEILDSLKEKSEFKMKFNVDKEERIFIDIFYGFLKDIAIEFGEEALALLGISGFKTTKFVREAVKSQTKLFSREVNETTLEKLQKQIQEAQDKGEDIGKVKDRIMTIFNSATRARAKMIARTEIAKSSNFGTLEGYKQSGVVKGKEWFTAEDERVEDICKGLHHTKVYQLDGKFKNADQLFGNVSAPPAHVGCRCILLPITESRDQAVSRLKNTSKALAMAIIKAKKADDDRAKEMANKKSTIDQEIKEIEETLGLDKVQTQ